MERLFILLITVFSLTLVGCSGKKTAAEEGGMGVELTDADEFLQEEAGDVISEEASPIDAVAEEAKPVEEFAEENSGVNEFANTAPQVEATGDLRTYNVQKNETLMLIAFKLYGDYGKWKELAQLNSSLDANRLKVGDAIQYNAPMNEFVWSPQGNPYLIKGGDTLGTISSDTYGTNKYWRDIWSNNKPLIKDPNKIFVGFTIYTPVLENRDVASQL